MYAASSALRGAGSFRDHLLDFYKVYAAEGIVLRPLADLMDDTTVASKIDADGADLLEALRYQNLTLEVDERCLAWQQELQGTPACTWARFCEACQTTHVYAGRDVPEHWPYVSLSPPRVRSHGDKS